MKRKMEIVTKSGWHELTDILKIGTKNTTGKCYRKHFSIWVINNIQEKHTFLHDMFNLTPTLATGWVNGNLYTPTSKVLGILLIADDICVSSGMAEYIPALHRNEVAPWYWFLVKLQGTQKLVLLVHMPVEKKLFKELLENNLAFSSESGDLQWRLAVRIWNAEADVRQDVFYKVWVWVTMKRILVVLMLNRCMNNWRPISPSGGYSSI